ncbi:hypothetical protein OF83DRAFT_128071 [Amylostereum chailletii]|nr:hypothetical protein OF83DRAFT_128071 [Amylostereum chailletii]
MEAQIRQATVALKKANDLIAEEAQEPPSKKWTKERTRKILSNIQQIVAVLGGVSELHPVAKVSCPIHTTKDRVRN